MAKHKVAQFTEIPEGGIRRVKVGERDIALYKISGQIYATSNICSHEGCFLNENHKIQFDIVECMCHGSQFAIKTGEVIQSPATEGLKTYKVEVFGDDLYIEL